MAHSTNPRNTGLNRLSAVFVRQAKAPGIYLDGGGLRFQVTRSGGRRWFMRVTVAGKPRDLALGTADNLSMGEAREIAAAIRKAVGAGRDPSQALQQFRERAHPPSVAETRQPTFRDAWVEFWSLKSPQVASDKNRRLWVSMMESHALGHLGDLPVADIRASDIIEAMRPIWTSKPETARKVLQRIDAVFTTAITREWRERASPCIGVARELGRRRTESRHFAAMPYAEVSDFMHQLRRRGGLPSSRLCLEFVVLTAVRSGEARGARWGEIDMAGGVWTIPSERMKMHVEHAVPLSNRAIEILKEVRAEHPESDLVFPGTKAQQLSDMTLLKRLRDMGLHGQATVHGFRSTFKDWAAESGVLDEVSETALAHGDRNVVRAAYRRTVYLAERRELMQRWANYCCGFPQTREAPA